MSPVTFATRRANPARVESQLYAICVVYNPRRFESRWRLYAEFAKWVADSGVKLITVEISFGERAHAITACHDPWHLQLRTRHELWHKERALNLGLRRLAALVPDWRYVAWLDTDVRLARPDWAVEAVHLLQHYAIIQLFEQARLLGPDYQNLYVCRSVARTIEDHGLRGWGGNPGVTAKAQDPYLLQGHPGLAWAFRRDELNDVGGWLDTCINGSGDLHMAACYAGDWSLVTSPASSPGYQASIRKYGRLCERYVRRNIHFMPGVVDHYWHGRSEQRGYQDRWKLVDKYQFDPSTDLIEDVSGLWKWDLSSPRVMAMAVESRRSLARRNEDVNEI